MANFKITSRVTDSDDRIYYANNGTRGIAFIDEATPNQLITLSGDINGSGTSGIVTTLATVNSNVGTFGNNTTIPSITVNGKGLVTAISNSFIGNASASSSGLLTSTDWNTFNNKVSASATPSSGQVAIFNGSNTLYSTSGFTYDGLILTTTAKVKDSIHIASDNSTSANFNLRTLNGTNSAIVFDYANKFIYGKYGKIIINMNSTQSSFITQDALYISVLHNSNLSSPTSAAPLIAMDYFDDLTSVGVQIGISSTRGFTGDIYSVDQPGTVRIKNTYLDGTAYSQVGNTGFSSYIALSGSGTSTKATIPAPKMTTATRANITPATGMMVYDTTLNSLLVYAGSNWSGTKIYNIGDWNMDSSNTVNVAHGLSTVYKNIKSITVTIRDDNDTNYYTIPNFIQATGIISAGIVSYDSTNIVIGRTTSGFFDSTTFDSTSYNRGWVTIILG